MAKHVPEVKESAEGCTQFLGDDWPSRRRGTAHTVQQSRVPNLPGRWTAIDSHAYSLKKILDARVKGMEECRNGVDLYRRQHIPRSLREELGMPLHQPA